MKNLLKVLGILLVSFMMFDMVACRGKNESVAAAGSTVGHVLDQPQKHNVGSGDTYPALRVKSAKTIVVGYLHQTLDSETIKRQTRQMQIEAAHRGWNLREAIYEQTNRATIRDAFMSLITQDVYAITIYNTEPQGFADLVIEARKKGIGVYNIDSEMTPGVIANSCVPNGVAASQLAYWLGERFTWQANVAFITIPVLQVHMERVEPPIAIYKQYNGMNVVGYETIAFDAPLDSQCYDYSMRFLQKFGEDLDIIFGSWDGVPSNAMEAARSIGNKHVIAVGIDGGSLAFANIRKNSTFQATYAQACEMYSHKVCELIDQLQIKGMKPGDPGSLISTFGETMYSNGVIVTPQNVPAPGESIHVVQEYYDPSDKGAWYFWDDGKGIYTLE